MKGVVVTGATSMIGVALIEECVRNNVPVAAIVRPDTSRLDRLPESELITIYEYKLDELGDAYISGFEGAVFYHFAWGDTGKTTRDDPVLQEKNIKYTLDAVGLAKRTGCTAFIGAGSQAEYGPVDGIISHKTDTNPVIAYGMAKDAARLLSSKLCISYGMRHVWGRIFSVYGRYDNAGTMLVYAIQKLLAGDKAEFSAGTQMWDYLNEHDAGRAFYLLGDCECAEGIYCVAYGESRPLRNFINELGQQLDAADRLVFAEPSDKKPMGLQADISRLRKDTGFEAEIPFAKGIAEMIGRYREQL